MSALIRNGRVELVRLHDALDQALLSLQGDAPELAPSFVYVWASGFQMDAQVRLPPNAVALDSSQLQEFGGSLLVPESHGKRLAHDEPVPHLLFWLCQL